MSQIDAQLAQLKATQQYLYWRERRHRQTVEATHKKVWWFAMGRSALLVGVSVGQVRVAHVHSCPRSEGKG